MMIKIKYNQKIDDFFGSLAKWILILTVMGLLMYFVYPYIAGQTEFFIDYHNSK